MPSNNAHHQDSDVVVGFNPNSIDKNFGDAYLRIHMVRCKVHPSLLLQLFHTVAVMQFSQLTYSQPEDLTPLQVNLVLLPFGGSGTGSASITQDIVEQITAFAQAGDTATGMQHDHIKMH